MADAYSGSLQELTVDGQAVHGVDSGFTGLTLTYDADSFTVDSGGLRTMHNAGPVAVSGSFGCAETEQSNRALLGQNGQRKRLSWKRGPAATAVEFDAILQVSRTFTDRGMRSYSVTVTVDGPAVA